MQVGQFLPPQPQFLLLRQKPVSQQATTGNSSVEFITYTVRQGDSLWEIARKYPGTTETDIARLNNITNAAEIKPGQVIRIKPKG